MSKLTHEEVKVKQQKSHILWERSNGLMHISEQTKLRHQAHPYHPCISTKGSLHFCLSACGKYLYISDAIHFISIIDAEDSKIIPELLQMEAQKPGSVSQYLTAKSPILDLESAKDQCLALQQELKPKAFTLADLGLT